MDTPIKDAIRSKPSPRTYSTTANSILRTIRPKVAHRPITESKFIHTTRVPHLESQKQIERISRPTIIPPTGIRMPNVFTNWTNLEQGNTQHSDSIYHHLLFGSYYIYVKLFFNLYLSSQIHITVKLCAGIYAFFI